MARSSMKRARVQYADKERTRLRCMICGTEWTDWGNRPADSRVVRGKDRWRCPKGCNAEIIEDLPPPGEIEGGS